jgi:hypothetical protein
MDLNEQNEQKGPEILDEYPQGTILPPLMLGGDVDVEALSDDQTVCVKHPLGYFKMGRERYEALNGAVDTDLTYVAADERMFYLRDGLYGEEGVKKWMREFDGDSELTKVLVAIIALEGRGGYVNGNELIDFLAGYFERFEGQRRGVVFGLLGNLSKKTKGSEFKYNIDRVGETYAWDENNDFCGCDDEVPGLRDFVEKGLEEVQKGVIEIRSSIIELVDEINDNPPNDYVEMAEICGRVNQILDHVEDEDVYQYLNEFRLKVKRMIYCNQTKNSRWTGFKWKDKETAKNNVDQTIRKYLGLPDVVPEKGSPEWNFFRGKLLSILGVDMEMLSLHLAYKPFRGTRFYGSFLEVLIDVFDEDYDIKDQLEKRRLRRVFTWSTKERTLDNVRSEVIDRLGLSEESPEFGSPEWLECRRKLLSITSRQMKSWGLKGSWSGGRWFVSFLDVLEAVFDEDYYVKDSLIARKDGRGLKLNKLRDVFGTCDDLTKISAKRLLISVFYRYPEGTVLSLSSLLDDIGHDLDGVDKSIFEMEVFQTLEKIVDDKFEVYGCRLKKHLLGYYMDYDRDQKDNPDFIFSSSSKWLSKIEGIDNVKGWVEGFTTEYFLSYYIASYLAVKGVNVFVSVDELYDEVSQIYYKKVRKDRFVNCIKWLVGATQEKSKDFIIVDKNGEFGLVKKASNYVDEKDVEFIDSDLCEENDFVEEDVPDELVSFAEYGEDVLKLIAGYRNGDRRMGNEFMRVSMEAARRWIRAWGYVQSVDMDELMQESLVYVMGIADKYDPKCGIAFWPYCYNRVRPLLSRFVKKHKKVVNVSYGHIDKVGRGEATHFELSLDEAFSSDTSGTLYNVLGVSDGGFSELEDASSLENIVLELRRLLFKLRRNSYSIEANLVIRRNANWAVHYLTTNKWVESGRFVSAGMNKGINYDELALQSGVSKSAVSHAIRGIVSDVLPKLRRMYDA